MFVIYKAFIDPMENEPESAFGYRTYMVALTREEAEAFCASGRTLSHSLCWAIPEAGAPEFKYEEIPLIAG